jgi:hypothetical protein
MDCFVAALLAMTMLDVGAILSTVAVVIATVLDDGLFEI